METTWTEVVVRTPVSVLERAEGALHMSTPLGLYIEDFSDFEEALRAAPGMDLIDGGLLTKDRSNALVHVYFQPGLHPAECAESVRGALLRAGLSEGGGDDDAGDIGDNIFFIVSVGGIAEEDWANNWKKYFKPLRVGEGILIMPDWEMPDCNAFGMGEGTVANTVANSGVDSNTDSSLAAQDNERLLEGANAVVRIDPGMAFGTGSHATTRLCLVLLEKYFRKAGGVCRQTADMLDLGCGSGILSIAAVALGARSALGVDIDKYAVRNAAENAERNGVTHQVKFMQGDLASGIDGRFHVITANIVADIVIKLLRTVGSLLHTDGTLILSGIIDEREADVRAAALENGFVIADILRDEGWSAMSLNHNAP